MDSLGGRGGKISVQKRQINQIERGHSARRPLKIPNLKPQTLNPKLGIIDKKMHIFAVFFMNIFSRVQWKNCISRQRSGKISPNVGTRNTKNQKTYLFQRLFCIFPGVYIEGKRGEARKGKRGDEENGHHRLAGGTRARAWTFFPFRKGCRQLKKYAQKWVKRGQNIPLCSPQLYLCRVRSRPRCSFGL